MPDPDTRSPVPEKRASWRAFVAAALVVVPGWAAVAGCLWRPDPLAPLTLVPPWCWLPAGIVSTVHAWRIGWRKTAVALAWLWCSFAVLYVEELPSLLRSMSRIRSASGAGERQLRVVSLNCAGSPRVLRDLERVKPDLLLLQEAPGEDQLREISRALFGEEGGVLAGGDTAILARGAIQAGFVDPRAPFVTGRVKFGDGFELECVSLRLSPPVSRLDFWTGGFWREHRELRHRHRRELWELVTRLSEQGTPPPRIVGGDFNTTPLDPALDTLRPQLADGFARHGRGWGATGTNDWPLFRVDQIWTDARVSVSSVQAVKSVSSDHRMVIVEIVVGGR